MRRQLLTSATRIARELPEFREFRLYAEEQGWTISDKSVYIMLTKSDPNYVAVAYRLSDQVQCYWLGYGHLQKQKRFSEFANPQECLDWIQENFNMELSPAKRPTVSVTKYMERQMLIDDIFAQFYEGIE